MPIGLLLLTFLCIGCKLAQPHSVEMKVIAIEDERDLIGKWSFTSHWSGHMGIALELKEDGTFDYWKYSDFVVQPEPEFPIVGQWELVKGVLNLVPEDDRHLYANDWVWVEYEEHQGLFNVENLNVLIWHKRTPDTRMLYRNDEAVSWPMMNMPNPDVEYFGGGRFESDETNGKK